jgi:hypothetical protein
MGGFDGPRSERALAKSAATYTQQVAAVFAQRPTSHGDPRTQTGMSGIRSFADHFVGVRRDHCEGGDVVVARWPAVLDEPPAQWVIIERGVTEKSRQQKKQQFPCLRHKKNPQAVYAPGGSGRLLPHFRLLCWAAGVSGDGGRPAGLIDEQVMIRLPETIRQRGAQLLIRHCEPATLFSRHGFVA